MADVTTDYAARLENYSLFKGVSDEDRKALVEVMQHKHFANGEVLFNRGDPGDSMYIILNGAVRIYTQDDEGNEFTFRHLTEMFGEFAVLDSRPRSAAAAASEDLDVLILHRDNFIEFLNKRPAVGLSLMRNLVERVRYTTTYLQEVMDATRQLAQGRYEFNQSMAESETGSVSEIQELIGTFIQMAQEVQSREQVLQRALHGQDAQSNSSDNADHAS